MLSLWNLTLTLLALSLLVKYSNALQTFAPFRDTLTLNPHYGESSQVVEHLGRMIKLQTSVSQYSVFPCTFTIQTRTTETSVTFKPGHYCVLGICGDYKFDLQKLALSGFDPSRRTIILVAGFMSGNKVGWIDRIASLWLAIEDVNIIKVGWAEGCSYVYVKAVSGTPIVAREITILLHHLAGLNGYSFTDSEFAKKILMVGHSLGAHIAGFVGQDLGGRLGRITGLDPAGVFFDLQPRELRLDPTDARLVDVIHTSGGKFHYHNFVMSAPQAGLDWLIDKVPLVGRLHTKLKNTMGESYSREENTTWFGIDQQVGHIDYYANNGRIQPDCDSYLHICDHGRSSEIYLDLLAYEQKMLHNYGEAQRKVNRLLTFKADDYDSFFVGANLATECRQIVETGFRRRGQNNFDKSLKRCSLPIDLTGPVDDLIQEYSTEYGLAKAFEQPNELTGFRHYFSTTGHSPLVGNHMMLKIYPSAVLDAWTSQCSLRAEITLADGSVTRISMLQDSTKPVGINNIVGGPLVFTALFTAPTERPIRYIVNQGPKPSDFATNLPTNIRLSASSVGVSHSAIKAVANKAWSYFSVKSKASKCTMIIRSVEVLPLLATENAYVGRYENLGVGDHLSADQELQLHLASAQLDY